MARIRLRQAAVVEGGRSMPHGMFLGLGAVRRRCVAVMRVVSWLRCDVGVDRAIVRDAGGRVFVARCRRLRLGGGRAGVL